MRKHLTTLIIALSITTHAFAADWSDEQISKLPAGEMPVRLFDGKGFTGWEGHIGKYFSVQDGVIIGKNTQENAPRASAYLLTKQNYRDFRLIFESKLVTSEMHSGIALWGKPIEKEDFQKIDARMREFADAKQIAGAVTLVARRGRVVHVGTIGKADIAAGRDMAKDTLFAIASMTKPITAAAVMILQDEGKVALDDPVSKYIAAFRETKLKDGKKPAREITVRDCLTHTNGLVSDQRNVGTLANTAEQLAKSELAFEPGSKWQYGPGLSVAGRVVEVASGKPFDQFLAERVFQPLDMKETTFRPSAEQRQRLARLYQPTSDKKDIEPGTHWLVELSPDTTPNPSGGLYSTAYDLVRFYQMVLNGGDLDGKRVLSEAAVRQLTTLQTGELETGFTPGTGWGLGFCLIREPQGVTGMLSPGSYGHGGAFGTQGWIDPAREMIFVLLIARQNFGSGDASDIRGEFQRLAVEAIRD